MAKSYTLRMGVQLLFLSFFSLPALCRLTGRLLASSILLNLVGNGQGLLGWLVSPQFASKVLCECFV